MQPLLILPPPDAPNILESGIAPSLPAKASKLWLDATNVLFIDRGVEKARGITAVSSIVGDIFGISQAFVDGQQRAYLGTVNTFYQYSDGDTAELASGFGGGNWSIIPWGTWVLATNGIDPVQVCKNDTVMVPLANVPVGTARIIRKLAQRPIIFAGQTAYWPRATDIEYWTVPDPTGNAGSFFIRDLDSDIVAVEPFGEFLAYYTNNQMGLVTFIGGASVYGFKNRIEGIGAIGLNAIVPVGQKHYGMSANGFWVTDGSSFDYLEHPAIDAFFDAHVDKTLGDRITGVHVRDRQMVAWFFRDVDGSIHGLEFCYGNGSWQHLQMPITAAAAQEVFDGPLAAASGGEWGVFDASSDVGGATMTSSLRTAGFDAGEPQRFKHWELVQVNIEATNGVDVRFGLHRYETMGAHPDDYWTDWAALGRDNYLGLGGGLDSVYLSMELRSLTFGVSWRIGGLSVHGTLGGWAQ